MLNLVERPLGFVVKVLMAALNRRRILAIILILRRRRRRRNRLITRNRRHWIDPVNFERNLEGAYVTQFLKYRNQNREKFYRYSIWKIFQGFEF